MNSLQEIIERAWDDRSLLKEEETIKAVKVVIDFLDQGLLRVAEPIDNQWKIYEWVKKAVVLYFPIQKMETLEAGIFEYHIGAYVDEGTMVDTWATVGSCAQIGKGVHLSGGVGIGGVLEPLQASPVIIEDGAFIGSRCIVVEGVRVGKEAVLGANVVLTMSTKIIDVTGNKPLEMKGYVPERSVVIPGSLTKTFPAGDYNVPCALIIGKRKESTNKKTSLNNALREYDVAV